MQDIDWFGEKLTCDRPSGVRFIGKEALGIKISLEWEKHYE